MPDDDRVRSTVRLPEEAYDALCEELPSFSTDTARFQFLVQFYLDYKQQIRASEHGKGYPPAPEQSADNQSETDTPDEDNSTLDSNPDSQD